MLRKNLYRSDAVKVRSLGWAKFSMTNALIKGGDLDADTRAYRENAK